MLRLGDLDLEMIAGAMQDDGSMGAEYYLNLDTGNVMLPGFDEDMDPEDLAEGDHPRIDRVESFESFRHMEDFTYALADGPARQKLEQALIRSKPFRHFRETLESFPRERKAWLEFKDEAMREVVIRWLVSVGAIEDPSLATGSEDVQDQ